MDQVKAGANFVLHPKTVLYSTIKTRPDYLNPAVLHQKYAVERLSVRQVAELIGSSKTAVLDGLRRFKIPIRDSHQPHGRPANPPYGYQLVRGRLVEHPREKKTIQMIKKMYLRQGLSLNAIAKALTRDGVPTKKGKVTWHHEMVRSILKKERLT